MNKNPSNLKLPVLTDAQKQKVRQNLSTVLEKLLDSGGTLAGIIALVPCNCRNNETLHYAMELQWGTIDSQRLIELETLLFELLTSDNMHISTEKVQKPS